MGTIGLSGDSRGWLVREKWIGDLEMKPGAIFRLPEGMRQAEWAEFINPKPSREQELLWENT